jgi:hypothetical protein
MRIWHSVMIGAKQQDDLISNPSGSICNFYLYGTSDWEKALEREKKEKKRNIEEKEKIWKVPING